MINTRFNVWLGFVLGALGLGGLVGLTYDGASSIGDAVGYAFIPAVAGGALGAFLAFRHNRTLARRQSPHADNLKGPSL